MSTIIAVLSGDGIGPEVMTETVRVLRDVCGSVRFEFIEGLIGGAAFDKFANHFPDETKTLCDTAGAILFGSVGGPVGEAHLPKWKGCETNSILALRKTYRFHANLRPIQVYPALSEISPLKDSILAGGVNLLIVRELLGDIYFGPRSTSTRDGKRHAYDTAEYDEDQVAAVAHAGFRAAMLRKKRLTSVDKANVLDTSKLWRTVVSEVHQQYPEVILDHMLVDNCAMQIVRNPGQFDVIVTSNMFGDILSDAAAVIPGSLGLTPSASLNPEGFGLFEPSGGSAPDIAGLGIANPIAQLLSAALMLRYSFALEPEARAIETAIDAALTGGVRTRDIAPRGSPSVGTREFADEVLRRLGGGKPV